MATKTESLKKAQLLVEDLNKLENLSNSVAVDGNCIKINLPFNTSKISQAVATVIAHSINGSKEMNKVRRELNKEVRDLLLAANPDYIR